MSTALTQVFRLPDLGEGLTEAELVGWLVAVGDDITVDQPIAEVETAKSTVELPSPFAGRIVALHGTPGSLIPVGAAILEVEPAASAHTPASEPTAPTAPTEPTTSESSGQVLIGYGTTTHAGGHGRRRARAATAQRVAATPPAPTAAMSRTAVRSPLVRRLARDLGVDVASITATGADGAVTRNDVLQAVSNTGSPAAPVAASTPPGLAEAHRERMSMLRRSAAATFVRSRSEIPEATVWVDVDITALWELRTSLASATAPAPSLTALLGRFVVLALAEYPLLAGRLDGDDIITFDGVNLGFAADTPRGLVVPHVSRADTLTLGELDDAIRSLTLAAREGTITPDALTGSTFTVNNYGAFGVDGSAAIINYPEVAILGIGRAIEKPWVVDGALAVRRIAQLSLVFDHRVCDGGYASGFLSRVVQQLEHPFGNYRRI